MVQGGGDVGIGLIAYVREVGIRTVDVKVNAVAMEELVWCVALDRRRDRMSWPRSRLFWLRSWRK